MKKFLNKIGVLFLTTIFFPLSVKADSVDIPDNFKLQPIIIPLFTSANTVNFSIFSWLAFAGGLATVGLVIFWVFLIIKAAIGALQSEGKPEGLAEAGNKVKSVFIGMLITFLFPAVLSVAGAFLGIGNIFQWPKMLSVCNSSQYNYYFQAFLKEPDTAEAVCNPKT